MFWVVFADTFACSEASEIRNAGGRAGPALRSIICLDHLVGVGTVVVIHHTGELFPLQTYARGNVNKVLHRLWADTPSR